jgi:hypothetical protein
MNEAHMQALFNEIDVGNLGIPKFHFIKFRLYYNTVIAGFEQKSYNIALIAANKLTLLIDQYTREYPLPKKLVDIITSSYTIFLIDDRLQRERVLFCGFARVFSLKLQSITFPIQAARQDAKIEER